MDGVFINLTDKNVTIKSNSGEFIIKGNKDFLTPVTEEIPTDNILSGIVSNPLKEKDIYTIQSTQMLNTVYTRIERSEQNATMVNVTFCNPYVKHPFTDHQINQINKISNGRTRLLILEKKDAIYWSSGNFKPPFDNYRLFTYGNEGNLIEYPIPLSYKHIIYSGLKKIFGN